MSDTEAIKQRRVTSFEVDEDVAEILEKARSEGVRIGWLVNQSIRRFRPAIKAQMATEGRPMSPEPSATERLMEEAELDNLLANGWRLSSSVWMADGNHVLLRKGDQVIGATVTANTQAGGRKEAL